MIQDRKITAYTKTHAMLADNPNANMSAAELKAWWDTAPEEAKVAHNGLIDDLANTTAGSSGAEQIGSAPITGVVGSNVYAQMVDIKNQINLATVGDIPNGSITPAKLSFDPATQDELNAIKTANYDDRIITIDITVGVGKQFTSISAAINSLKKVNAGPRTITINPGTYDESVTINNFIGGKITLQAASGSIANIIVNDVFVNDNKASIELNNLKISSIGAGFRFQNNEYVLLQNFDVTNAGSGGGIILTNIARARLSVGTVSNRGYGISAYTSWVYLESISGTANNIGIEAASGSIVQKNASSITGTTAELKSGGSQIWS